MVYYVEIVEQELNEIIILLHVRGIINLAYELPLVI